MTEQQLGEWDVRITRLETTQLEMREQLGRIGTAIDRLSGEFQQTRRPQYQLMLMMGSIFIALISMAGGTIMFAGQAALVPIEQRMASMISINDRHDRRIEELMRDRARLETTIDRISTQMLQQFTEVETQFLALSNQTNLRQAEHERLFRLLWNRTYGESLPGNGVWPTVGKP